MPPRNVNKAKRQLLPLFRRQFDIRKHPINTRKMAPSPLDIKASALTRLMKEHKLYLQEHAEQEAHIASLKASNADPYDIKKQVEVLEDTQRVIPEIKKKVGEMLVSLEESVKEYDGAEDLTTAKEKIAEAKEFLS